MNVTATVAAVVLAAGGIGGGVADPVPVADQPAPAPSVSAPAQAPAAQQWAPFSPWWMAPAPAAQQGQGGSEAAPGSPFLGGFPVFLMFPAFGGMGGGGEAGQPVSWPWMAPWGQQGQQQVSWPAPTVTPAPAPTEAPAGEGVPVETPAPLDGPVPLVGDAGDDNRYHEADREDVYIGTPPKDVETSEQDGKGEAESFDTERGKREKEGREGK